MSSVTDLSKFLFERYINKNSVAVDATCGNGNDTLHLASKSKFVYAFDIQKEALKSAKNLTKEFNNIKFINDGHENLDKFIKENVDLIVFNLGYLPGKNKDITTKYETTLKALKISLKLIKPEKAIIMTVYPGHEEGKRESLFLKEYLKTLDYKKFDIFIHELFNKPNNPPFIYEIVKKRFL